MNTNTTQYKILEANMRAALNDTIQATMKADPSKAFEFIKCSVKAGVTLTKQSIELLKNDVTYEEWMAFVIQCNSDVSIYGLAVGTLQEQIDQFMIEMQKLDLREYFETEVRGPDVVTALEETLVSLNFALEEIEQDTGEGFIEYMAAKH